MILLRVETMFVFRLVDLDTTFILTNQIEYEDIFYKTYLFKNILFYNAFLNINKRGKLKHCFTSHWLKAKALL